MSSQATSRIAAVGAHAGMQLLRVLFWAPVLLLLAWMAFFGTDRWRNAEHWRRFPPSFGCDDSVLLDSCTLSNLLYMWAAPALLAAAALGLLVLRAVLHDEDSHVGHRSRAAAKWSALLLPPRRFWLWWCGGISVADLLVLAAWAAINAAWMYAMLDRYFKLIPIFSGSGTPLPLLQLQLVAVALGSLLFPNLVLLFYPVTRGSVVLQASGISYPDAIRYHRWLGHAVMVMVTAHSLGFWGVWLYQGLWVKEALDQGPRINNLAGGISFLSGLALWLSSLEVARRASYETFYKLHHIGFWGFMFAGCCHYWGMFWYFLPGLMLYGVDAVYRLHQSLWERSSSKSQGCNTSGGDNKTPGFSASGSVQVLEAVTSPGGSMVSLLLAAPRYGVAATGFVWLSIPEVNRRLDWHPFEYIAVPLNPSHKTAAAATGATTGLLVHIKAYDRWTKSFTKLVQNSGLNSQAGVNFTVKMEGPYAELPGPVMGYPEVTRAAAVCGSSSSGHKGKSVHGSSGMVDGVIIAAGGIGITAAFSVFQELAAAGAAVAGLPALIIWACRKPDELEFLAPRLLAMARALGLSTTLKLYCTGDPSAAPTKQLAAAAVNTSTTSRTLPPAAAATAAAGSSSSSSGLVTTSLCPVVGLGSYFCQAGHKLLLHVIAFAGTLGGILLVRYLSAVLPDEPWTTGQMGAAYVTVITAGILLPGTLALWGALAVQRCQRSGFSGCLLKTLWARVRGGSSSSSSSERAAAQSEQKELSEPLLSAAAGSERAAAAAAAAEQGCVHADNAAAAAAGPSAVAAAALAAKRFAQLRAAEAAAATPKVQWQLHLPAGDAEVHTPGAEVHGEVPNVFPVFPVEVGRPPVEQLVRSWMASVQQLPAAAADNSSSSSFSKQQQQFDVFGMGPTPLVASVQMLCDDLNRAGGASVNFVQKTHEL